MKLCSGCKLSKPNREFSKNCCKKDGLSPFCKECNINSSRIYYSKNKEKHLHEVVKHKKRHVERNRQFVYEYLQTHPCIDCGECDPIVLQFDHIENKAIEVSRAVNYPYSLERLKKEIEKCEIRCANCHSRKTAIERRYWITRV